VRSISKRTIAKFLVFVILFALLSVHFTACSGKDGDERPARPSNYSPPQVVGRITDGSILESSGLAASKCTPNVYWTHNDSGDDALIFALNETGRTLGVWKVADAENLDWEDIAEFKDKRGACYLYIGDIGDNELKRSEHKIYRIAEPVVSLTDEPSERNAPRLTEPASVIAFNYPDGPHDAETLLVHPVSGDIYVLTKRLNGPSGIYRLRSRPIGNTAVTAERAGEVKVPAVPNGYLTGGDISPDGKRVVLCDYASAYEFSLPADAADFDAIWSAEPSTIDLGERKVGEAICYAADGSSIFATSERKNAPFIRVMRK